MTFLGHAYMFLDIQWDMDIMDLIDLPRQKDDIKNVQVAASFPLTCPLPIHYSVKDENVKENQ